MKNIYMAIWYSCNQKCTGCPVANNRNVGESLSLNEIVERFNSISDTVSKNETVNVTISGGEPTLHPDFFRILDEIKDRNYKVAILTNAEKFGEKSFCDEFLSYVDLRNTTVVTTIHGSNSLIHESQNLSKGSFDKSIKGLQYLSFKGVRISIKHCITGKNYKDTKNFIRFIDDNFHPSVDIQLWGIDYCGLSVEQAHKLYVSFKDMRQDIESGLDYYLERRAHNFRQISLNNIPLCSIDPYYWDLLLNTSKRVGAYSVYFDPTTKKEAVYDDSGKFSKHCKSCDVAEYCSGAYRSLFEYFGDDVVYPIKEVE